MMRVIEEKGACFQLLRSVGVINVSTNGRRLRRWGSDHVLPRQGHLKANAISPWFSPQSREKGQRPSENVNAH